MHAAHVRPAIPGWVGKPPRGRDHQHILPSAMCACAGRLAFVRTSQAPLRPAAWQQGLPSASKSSSGRTTTSGRSTAGAGTTTSSRSNSTATTANNSSNRTPNYKDMDLTLWHYKPFSYWCGRLVCVRPARRGARRMQRRVCQCTPRTGSRACRVCKHACVVVHV